MTKAELGNMLAELMDVATNKTKHDYAGGCPDSWQLDARDEECPACQVLLRVERALA